MSVFINNLGAALLTVALSFVVLTLVVHPPAHEPSAPSVEILGSNRHLSFEVAGDTKQPNCIIWLHGLLSSRYEVLAIDKGVLSDLQAFLVSFDRPGYGDSTLHAGRNFVSAASDIATVADAFGASKFFVAGASVGGAYAWAAASLLPARVRGVLLLSAAGPPDMLEGEAATRERERLQGSREGFFLQYVSAHSLAIATFRWLTETYVGGRALYSIWLEDVARNILGRMHNVDARCIMKQKRTEYTLKILPESLKQGVATPVLQDLLLVRRQWPFNISQMPHHLGRATHIWHGSDDSLVIVDYAKAFKRRVPHSSLEIVEGGGHHAYWVCDKEMQRLAISRLIKSGLPG